MVQADRHSLLQVLLNLTKNSQRALEAVGHKTISISAWAREDGVSIRVRDNGPGIADPRHLFQPLQKAPIRPGSACICHGRSCDRFAGTCAMSRGRLGVRL